MLRASLFCLLTLPLLHGADDLAKPDKVTIHTWVREDIFAGLIGNDTAAFERGVKKIDRYLADHPGDRYGMAWKFTEAIYRMKLARTKGDDAAYAKQLAIAKELRTKVYAGASPDPGLNIIIGSSLVYVAGVAPEQDKTWMYRDARDLLKVVPELQGAVFERLPPHMRGELWAQLAYASHQLGDAAARDEVLAKMRTQLAGTPYESRARAWEKPENLAKEKSYACISCHEPGRLAPTLERVKSSAGN